MQLQGTRSMMPFFKALFASTVLIASAAPANAALVRPFDRAAFVAAQAANLPILIEVSAWWCPVCASQGKTIEAAIADPAYARLQVFKINYDRQKAEWQSFGVNRQGSLITFRGKAPLGRLDFITDKDQIRALLAQTVR
jgi:thioredoxin-like negative regulator of GroEL